jgi:hypothetical protein
MKHYQKLSKRIAALNDIATKPEITTEEITNIVDTLDIINREYPRLTAEHALDCAKCLGFDIYRGHIYEPTRENLVEEIADLANFVGTHFGYAEVKVEHLKLKHRTDLNQEEQDRIAFFNKMYSEE